MTVYFSIFVLNQTMSSGNSINVSNVIHASISYFVYAEAVTDIYTSSFAPIKRSFHTMCTTALLAHNNTQCEFRTIITLGPSSGAL